MAMRQPLTFILIAGWLIFLTGCAQKQSIAWRASDLETYSTTTIRLTTNEGQTVGFLSREKVKRLIDVKNKIEQVALGDPADLVIESSKDPNAFATIYKGRPVVGITLGMLELMGWDDDAYAAILGHEYAHLTLQHGETRSQREEVSKTTSNVLGFVLSRIGVPLGDTLANLSVTAVERAYTRDEERDADIKGFEYLMKAGYGPDGGIRLWQKMQAASTGFSIPFMSTHPMSQERIDTMKYLAANRARGDVVKAPKVSVQEAAEPPSPISESSAKEPLSTKNSDAYQSDRQKQIVVGKLVKIKAEPMNLYRSDSNESERVQHIYKRDGLVVEEISGDWIKVRLGSGMRGWVMQNWVVGVQ